MRQSGHLLSVTRVRPRRALGLLAAAGCALLAALAGGEARASGLFDETAEMSIVLEFPVRRMLRDRELREELPATLHYQGADGRRHSVPLKVRPRGHTRLALCDFPPLRLEFDPAHTADTPFAGEKGLKLVTQCRLDRRYRDYVRLEQRIYRAWGLLTPVAFRTRLLSVSYVDPTERMTPLSGPAFLIEDVDDVARRNGLRKRRVPALMPADVEPAQVALFELFQFMIGNTDWSVHLPTDGDEDCCHNGRVLGPRDGTGKFVVVPYDFDQSGIIDAEYAAVSPNVGVRRVRQRIYRGLCSRNAHVPAAIERFLELQPQLEQLFEGDGLGDWSARRAGSYLQAFFEILEDPAEVQRRIYDDCRPDPEMASIAAGTGTAVAAASGDSSFGRLP
jgi:hypothetical protein